MRHLLEHKKQNIKGDKAKIRTEQYIKLNTGAKEIEKINPDGPDNSQKHQAPTISSIDKSLRQNQFKLKSNLMT